MWPAAAGHTHSGGRERLIFGVLRVFRVKSTGQRARERERARRRMDFRSLFLRILGWGLEHAAESQPNSFPNFYGDRPVPIGQMWSDDRSLLKQADSSVIFSMKLVDRELSEEKILLLQQQTFSSK